MEYIFVCLRCGEQYKYKAQEVGRCIYCGGELAVETSGESAVSRAYQAVQVAKRIQDVNESFFKTEQEEL